MYCYAISTPHKSWNELNTTKNQNGDEEITAVAASILKIIQYNIYWKNNGTCDQSQQIRKRKMVPLSKQKHNNNEYLKFCIL